MNDSKQLAQLQKLTALKLDVAHSEMSLLWTKEAALRSNLDQLVQTRCAQSQAPRAPYEAALIAGADIRWHRWVDQRRAVINHELAQVLAQKAVSRIKLQKAFGKDQAAQHLKKQVAAEVRQTTVRRATYES